LDDIEFVLDKVDGLKASVNVGAGLLPIPSKLDDETSAVIKRFIAAAAPERKEIASLFTREHTDVLLGFAERMASLAVRLSRRDLIEEGLAAVVLERGMLDAREDMLVLAPLCDSAETLGLDAGALFRAAASLLPGELSRIVAAFPDRPAKSRGLDAMGYVASSDDDGFRYRRTW
jgi:hypothetical protein